MWWPFRKRRKPLADWADDPPPPEGEVPELRPDPTPLRVQGTPQSANIYATPNQRPVPRRRQVRKR
jgi:hypothetical protein